MPAPTPADVPASQKNQKKGELPHLTRGRAIMGGIMALSLLFGGAGAYVLVTGRPVSLGPAEAGAFEAATAIAVVPFSVNGADLEVWREGMVDVLSTSLDGLGGFRAIDSRTVLARWHRPTPARSPAQRTLRHHPRELRQVRLRASVQEPLVLDEPVPAGALPPGSTPFVNVSLLHDGGPAA